LNQSNWNNHNTAFQTKKCKINNQIMLEALFIILHIHMFQVIHFVIANEKNALSLLRHNKTDDTPSPPQKEKHNIT
jgi:hypothetical protein